MTPQQFNKLGNHALTDTELRSAAPSIFATQPWQGMSSRYTFIPTIDVVNALRNEGFQPFAAAQSSSRIEGKGEFTKHLIRFRDVRSNALQVAGFGGVTPEVLLINSHDGGSAYAVMCGCFRLVCSNGLVICSSGGTEMAVRHTGSADGVVSATFEIVKEFPVVMNSIERFANLRLEAGQQKAFASAALELKYDIDAENPAPITPDALIVPTRTEDAEPTLWNTFNTVQEKLIGGGQRYLKANSSTKAKRMRTRPVKGIAENTRLNKALWKLAEEMHKLAA